MLRYTSEKMMKGARVVVKTCLNVKAGEKVLIVTDTGRDISVAQALFEAALKLDAEPVIAVMTPRKHPGDEPPYNVSSAMKVSDVIICPTTATVYHSDARVEACKAGARFLSMTGATPKTLAAGPIFADFEEQKPKVEKLASLFMKAEEIRLTTPAGTDIKAKIKGRVAHAETALCHEPGCCMGAPDIEANITPIEDTTEGVIIVDGSISVIPGVVKTQVRVEVYEGSAVKITGDGEASKLKEILRKADDPKVYVVAEFGVGFNPKAKVRGVSNIEDEATLGTAHIALGDNHTMGGKNTASMHVDMIVMNPTIYLDGKVVFNKKRLVV